ncbi:hypothetical protein A3D54_03940 [Candidatus Falkowbacteria bacterium RIFCSPHIGHO2_02_FULL_45_15]|uniref:Uncharacterized protein n=1 Tax=Candidatus Falkowbacteria bacterium RIFCSPHIGHO2_02_FULL_45_15 TaxID=1797987 RepID=A0A1F5RZP9_9BACT|nr:MAG: hypothetical protein A3D54_03940 [Candidatus Falkowbacteria bacterium RIFCSPHIGHO2_02_FULL_45_15]
MLRNSVAGGRISPTDLIVPATIRMPRIANHNIIRWVGKLSKPRVIRSNRGITRGKGTTPRLWVGVGLNLKKSMSRKGSPVEYKQQIQQGKLGSIRQFFKMVKRGDFSCQQRLNLVVL